MSITQHSMIYRVLACFMQLICMLIAIRHILDTFVLIPALTPPDNFQLKRTRTIARENNLLISSEPEPGAHSTHSRISQSVEGK